MSETEILPRCQAYRCATEIGAGFDFCGFHFALLSPERKRELRHTRAEPAAHHAAVAAASRELEARQYGSRLL